MGIGMQIVHTIRVEVLRLRFGLFIKLIIHFLN